MEFHNIHHPVCVLTYKTWWLERIDPTKGINITSWDGQTATEATWGNMLAISQYTYNENNKTTTTPEQVALATRTDGTMTIKVADCYAIKNKS